jgi:methyl-accepting chemotaxis protein
MKTKQKKAEPPKFLSGWKDIANYLGRGVRTVQRYERELGLPVRRPAGKASGSVVATQAELDAWVMASPIREVFHLSRSLNSSASATWASLEKGAAEMQRLREQMQALRQELRTSVELVRSSVQGLHGNLKEGSQHLEPSIASYVSRVQESHRLLSIDTGDRKTS